MEPMLEKYSTITVDDLLLDDFFIQSHSVPTPDSIAFWQQLMQQHPAQVATVSEAQSILQHLHAYNTPVAPPAGAAERGWTNLKAIAEKEHLFETTSPVQQPATIVPLFKKAWFKIAAAAVVVVGSFFAYQAVNKPALPSLVTTGYGKQQKLFLPDSSLVVLNGNSSIKFSKQWGNNETREVWIEGEAFLQVKHLAKNAVAANNGERFVVHLRNLDVEVLGTSFNVKSRKKTEEVMLQEGSVQLTANALDGTVKMEPGDVIVFDADSRKMLRKKSEPHTMNGWTTNQLHFDSTPLTEVVSMLEETYGLKITIANPTLLSRSISGDVTATNEDILLQAIEVMLDAKVARHNSEVIIK
ncbi:MAG TPA: FecR domain-containing protein [Phnomibacter sp.]|nr:FecR domain-containing protein [Phnomibacter sp.]